MEEEKKPDKCRICGEWEETVQHVIGGCTPLAGKDYLGRQQGSGMA